MITLPLTSVDLCGSIPTTTWLLRRHTRLLTNRVALEQPQDTDRLRSILGVEPQSVTVGLRQ